VDVGSSRPAPRADKLERFRHDTDDPEVAAVDVDQLAYDVRIGGVASFPEPIAQENHPIPAGQLFIVREQPPARRFHAQSPQNACGARYPPDSDGLAFVTEIEVVGLVDAELLEGTVVLPERIVAACNHASSFRFAIPRRRDGAPGRAAI